MLEKAIVWRAVEQMEERVTAANSAAEVRGQELMAFYELHMTSIGRAKEELQDQKQKLVCSLHVLRYSSLFSGTMGPMIWKSNQPLMV